MIFLQRMSHYRAGRRSEKRLGSDRAGTSAWPTQVTDTKPNLLSMYFTIIFSILITTFKLTCGVFTLSDTETDIETETDRYNTLAQNTVGIFIHVPV